MARYPKAGTHPARSAAGGEATPPITGGWDHGDQDSRPPSAIARRVVYSGLAAVRPILRIPESTFGVVVKASTKPWPRRLGCSNKGEFDPD